MKDAKQGTYTLSAAVSVLETMGCDAVAGFLHDQGYRGVQWQADGDPAGGWITDVTGAATARVSGYMIEVVYPGGRVDSVYTPTVVAEFMDAFDAGRFPFLVSDNGSQVAA